jgi:hypothetical protein
MRFLTTFGKTVTYDDGGVVVGGAATDHHPK